MRGILLTSTILASQYADQPAWAQDAQAADKTGVLAISS